MNARIVTAVVVAAVVGGSALVAGQSPEERISARTALAKRSDAVVMVLATLKLRQSIAGREQTGDQAVQTNATILDPSGLAVLSLSAIQPDDLRTRQLSQMVQPGTSVEVTSELADLKIHFADGKELPAKIVLRDADLDLAFVRPVDALPGPVTAVDEPVAKPQLMDPVMIVQRTSEATGWKTAASFGQVLFVIDQPRTYYQVAIPTAVSALGSPLFDPKGGFVGVIVYRSTGAKSSPSPAALAADDIREVAKQAK